MLGWWTFSGAQLPLKVFTGALLPPHSPPLLHPCILLWVAALSTGNGFGHCWGRSVEFCVAVGHVIRLLTCSSTLWLFLRYTITLTYLVKGTDCQLSRSSCRRRWYAGLIRSQPLLPLSIWMFFLFVPRTHRWKLLDLTSVQPVHCASFHVMLTSFRSFPIMFCQFSWGLPGLLKVIIAWPTFVAYLPPLCLQWYNWS